MPRGRVEYIASGQVIDAAYPPDGWWEDFPACGRYSAAGTWSKELTFEEVEEIAEHDAGILYFVEQSETTPINGSLDDDRALADAAAQMATDLDMPDGVPFSFAVDTDGRPYMDQVRAAFVTYRQRVPERWPLWAYAGSDVIDQLIADGTIVAGHIPAALSWSSTNRPVDNVEVFQASWGRWYKTPHALLLQHPSQAYRNGSIDRNDVLGPVPVWYPGRTPIPTQEGWTSMGSHIAYMDVVDDPGTTWLYFGELIMGNDGRLYRTDTANDAPGVYGLPRGRTTQSAYEALPVWNPILDAYWLADRIKERYPNFDQVGNATPPVDINAVADAVREKFRVDPLK